MLNTGSPSGISQSDEPRALEYGVVEDISHLRSPVSSDSTTLNSMALVSKFSKLPKQLTPPSRYHLDFKPGYEHGLFAILVKTAETFRYYQPDLSFKPNGKVRSIDPPLGRSLTAEDFNWAKNIIDLIYEYKQSESIPELSADVSHPYLKDIVATLNAYQHMLHCNTTAEPVGGPRVTMEKLYESHCGLVKARASRRSDRESKWRNLASQIRHQYNRHVLRIHLRETIDVEDAKATSEIMCTLFPLLASVEATVCDFGDSKYKRFQTTLASVPQCKFQSSTSPLSSRDDLLNSDRLPK